MAKIGKFSKFIRNVIVSDDHGSIWKVPAGTCRVLNVFKLYIIYTFINFCITKKGIVHWNQTFLFSLWKWSIFFFIFIPSLLVLVLFSFGLFSTDSFFLTKVSLGMTERWKLVCILCFFLILDYCYVVVLFAVIFPFCLLYVFISLKKKKKLLDSSFQMW